MLKTGPNDGQGSTSTQCYFKPEERQRRGQSILSLNHSKPLKASKMLHTSVLRWRTTSTFRLLSTSQKPDMFLGGQNRPSPGCAAHSSSELTEAIMWNQRCWFLRRFSFKLQRPMPSDSARREEGRRVTQLGRLSLRVFAHSPWTLRFPTDIQSSGGVFLFFV